MIACLLPSRTVGTSAFAMMAARHAASLVRCALQWWLTAVGASSVWRRRPVQRSYTVIFGKTICFPRLVPTNTNSDALSRTTNRTRVGHRATNGGRVHLPLRGHCRIAALLCLLAVLIPHQAFAEDRPWIGMDIVDCDTESGAVAVVHVEDDAPARDAGILPGDVVVSMNGLRLSGSDDFICRVSAQRAGQRVQFTVLRGGEVRFPAVRLGMWPLNIPQGRRSCPIQVSLADQPAASS